MSEKNENNLYPQATHMPQAPPQYEGYGTAPVQQQPPPISMVQPQIPLGPQPTRAVCPSCHATITTRTEYRSSNKTHIIATILCVTTCCCCIPYMIDSCKNVEHYCSECGAYLGAYHN